MFGQIHPCIIKNSTSTTMGMAKAWIKVTERTKQIQCWCHNMKMYSSLLSLCERNPAVAGELIPQRFSNLEFRYHHKGTKTLLSYKSVWVSGSLHPYRHDYMVTNRTHVFIKTNQNKQEQVSSDLQCIRILDYPYPLKVTWNLKCSKSLWSIISHFESHPVHTESYKETWKWTLFQVTGHRQT